MFSDIRPDVAARWKRLGIRLGVIVSLLTIVGMAWAATDYFRIRPMMMFEVESAIDDVRQDAGMSLEDLLLRKERRLWAVAQQIQSYQRARQPVPASLVDEHNLLTREIAAIKKRLG